MLKRFPWKRSGGTAENSSKESGLSLFGISVGGHGILKINFLYLLPRFVARRYSRVARGEIEHGPLSYNGRTLKICLVGADGVGPSTSFLSGKRSTAEPSAQSRKIILQTPYSAVVPPKRWNINSHRIDFPTSLGWRSLSPCLAGRQECMVRLHGDTQMCYPL